MQQWTTNAKNSLKWGEKRNAELPDFRAQKIVLTLKSSPQSAWNFTELDFGPKITVWKCFFWLTTLPASAVGCAVLAHSQAPCACMRVGEKQLFLTEQHNSTSITRLPYPWLLIPVPGSRLDTSPKKGQMHPQQHILPRLILDAGWESCSLCRFIYCFNKINFSISEVRSKLLSFCTFSKTDWQFLPAPSCNAWGAAASWAVCLCCCWSFLLCASSLEMLLAVFRLVS